MTKWVPQIGDKVYHVQEDHGCNIPGYDRTCYRITESVVTRPYNWQKGGMGIESSNGRCYFWKQSDYGTRVFRTFEDAIPLAEEMSDKYERIWARFNRPVYRHWREKDEKKG